MHVRKPSSCTSHIVFVVVHSLDHIFDQSCTIFQLRPQILCNLTSPIDVPADSFSTGHTLQPLPLIDSALASNSSTLPSSSFFELLIQPSLIMGRKKGAEVTAKHKQKTKGATASGSNTAPGQAANDLMVESTTPRGSPTPSIILPSGRNLPIRIQ